MSMKPNGLILEPIVPEDFLGGSSQSLEVKYGAEELVPSGDWTPYLPPEEDQSTRNGDTWACTAYATTNAIELLARRRFQQ